MKNSIRRPLAVAAAAATALAGTALLGPAPASAKSPDSEQSTSASLRQKVTLEGILEHERALQSIADANSDTRAAGFPGYDRSVDYVVAQLRAAGYDPVIDPFQFDFFATGAPAQLTLGGAPIATDYFTYSGAGDVTGQVQAVDINLTGTRASTSGCETSDFAGFVAGRIALVQRGTCDFAVKAANAAAAGATAVIIFNQGNTEARSGLLVGTLGSADFTIPVVGTSFADGVRLASAGTTPVRVVADTESGERTTYNVIADLVPSSGKRADDVVLVGAHLDSVPAGPGINDNGSGSSTILEIAQELAGRSGADKGNGLTNTVRFAWWGAEELGLLGSEAYVAELAEEDPAELERIKLNLNFDMVASPNYARFVYDGDNSAFPADGGVTSAEGPTGSGEIERVFTDYFKAVGLASGETPFSGRSDYGPFIAEGVDIPAGGLFTGAEGTKTAAEVQYFGGKAGVAYDPCYHQACDNLTGEDRTPAQAAALAGIPNLLGNLSLTGLDEMSDAAAHAVYVFAKRDLAKQPLVDPTTPVRGVATTASGGGNELHDDHDHEGERS